MVFALRKFLPNKTTPCKILVVSTTGLGDTIWASGVLTSLKERFPQLQIDLLTTPLGKELLASHIALSNIYTIPSRGWYHIFSLLRIFIKIRYETIFVFHSSQRWVFFLSALLKPKNLAGTNSLNKGLDHLFTHLTPFGPIHEIERRYLIVESVLGSLKRRPLDLPIYPSLTEKVEKTLDKLGPYSFENYIVIQPFAKDRFKQWPLGNFEQMMDFLIGKYHLPIFINSSKDELPMLEPLRSKNALFLADHFVFREILEVIRHAKLLLTNDTGPFHIGLSYQVPTVALFSPTDPSICGPYLAHKIRCIVKPPTCYPCIKQKCKEAVCMRQIQIHEVMKEISILMDASSKKKDEIEDFESLTTEYSPVNN